MDKTTEKLVGTYKFHCFIHHQQLMSPPPNKCCSATEKRLGNCLAYKVTLSEGEGVVMVFSLVGVFFKGN